MNSPITYATGRRKSSVARIFLSPGKGKITVNKKPLEEYFQDSRDREVILKVLQVTQKEKDYDLYITVAGGGRTGQKEAIRHGISHAIVRKTPESRPALKKLSYLTRDDRVVLPKRYGRKKHKKKPQFSKR